MALPTNYYQEILPVFDDYYDKDDELSGSDGAQGGQSVNLIDSIFFNEPSLVLNDEEGDKWAHEQRNWAV